MIQPWIEVPARDVRVAMPLSMADENVRILFRTTEAIDDAIAKLEELKKRMPPSGVIDHVC